MVRHPLFRDEDNANQAARPTQRFIPPHTDDQMHQKASPDDALWNRMNLAMRLSCQQPRLPTKR